MIERVERLYNGVFRVDQPVVGLRRDGTVRGPGRDGKARGRLEQTSPPNEPSSGIKRGRSCVRRVGRRSSIKVP